MPSLMPKILLQSYLNRKTILSFVILLQLATNVMALSERDIRHLSQRVAFGVSPEESQKLVSMTRDQAVTFYLQQADQGCIAKNIPEWAEHIEEPASVVMDKQAKQAYTKKRYARRVQLQAWWLNGMLASKAPLCDRMALFWHQYFPIMVGNTTSEGAAIRQVQRFRGQWAGNFRDILRDMSRDPVMQELLGLHRNNKSHPNENFARELLELYTLGSGYYSEQDIREAARAFTGWRTIRRWDMFVVWWPQHDFGEKTFLGKTGRWDGDDIIDIVLQQPRSAEFLVEKLWKEFISPTPSAPEVKRLAQKLRQHWSVRRTLEDMLRSDAFWNDATYDSLTKTPVDVAVGLLRESNVHQVSGNALAAWVCAMGQLLYQPPDVKGWRGGDDWITVQTLQSRQMFMQGLAQGFDDSMITALVQQVPEYPGFEESLLMKDADKLQSGLSKASILSVADKMKHLEYQVK